MLTCRDSPIATPTAACDCDALSPPAGAAPVDDCEGYPCECCPDGVFYPPPHTPARSAPCGYGWACADCPGMWFCPGDSRPTPAGGETGHQPPHRPMPLVMTTTAPPKTVVITSVVTSVQIVSSPSAPPSVRQPADHQGGWRYAGCYEDNTKRALKGDSNLLPGEKGMSNAACVEFCQSHNFTVSGTSFGSQCYCGDALVDSYRTGPARCNTTCSADSFDLCGGPMALTVYSPNGDPPIEAGQILAYTIPEPPPGATEMSVHIGGIRQTVIQVATPYFIYPAPMAMRPTEAGTSSSGTATSQTPGAGTSPGDATPPPAAVNTPPEAHPSPGSGGQNSAPPAAPPADTGSAAPVTNTPPPPPPLTVPPNAGQGSGGRYGSPFAPRAARVGGVGADHDGAALMRRRVLTVW